MKLFGKQVEAVYGSGGVNFTGRVVAYSGEPMYWIELPDGSKKWWAESLVKELPDVPVGPDEVWAVVFPTHLGLFEDKGDAMTHGAMRELPVVRYRRVEE